MFGKWHHIVYNVLRLTFFTGLIPLKSVHVVRQQFVLFYLRVVLPGINVPQFFLTIHWLKNSFQFGAIMNKTAITAMNICMQVFA